MLENELQQAIRDRDLAFVTYNDEYIGQLQAELTKVYTREKILRDALEKIKDIPPDAWDFEDTEWGATARRALNVINNLDK